MSVEENVAMLLPRGASRVMLWVTCKQMCRFLTRGCRARQWQEPAARPPSRIDDQGPEASYRYNILQKDQGEPALRLVRRAAGWVTALAVLCCGIQGRRPCPSL